MAVGNDRGGNVLERRCRGCESDARTQTFSARLGVYPGPTLILNGERDWVHRLAERTYAGVAQNARIEIIPHGGHVAGLDEPDAFTDAVRNFAHSLIR